MRRTMMATMLVATLSMFLLTLVASAQPRGPKPMSAAERTEQLKKDLDLTAVQTSKIKAIFEKQEQEMKKEFGPPPGDPLGPPMGEAMGEPDEMQKKMMEKQKELDAKIAVILTKEQKQKYDEIQKELRKGPGPPPGREDQ